jgi:hypothetical protein
MGRRHLYCFLLTVACLAVTRAAADDAGTAISEKDVALKLLAASVACPTEPYRGGGVTIHEITSFVGSKKTFKLVFDMKWFRFFDGKNMSEAWNRVLSVPFSDIASASLQERDSDEPAANYIVSVKCRASKECIKWQTTNPEMDEEYGSSDGSDLLLQLCDKERAENVVLAIKALVGN